MSQTHNILLTGTSGYLGGTLLTHLHDQPKSTLPYNTLYALVRTESQALSVREYGATPLTIDLNNPTSITTSIVEHEISIIFFLIDAFLPHTQKTMISALETVRRKTGRNVHFLHTTGAKAFSSHVGIAQELSDTDELYEIQRSTNAPREYSWFSQIARTNADIIDAAEEHGVLSYIFAPCIVYGEGTGYGNKISIQDVAVVKAARAAGRVYKVDAGKPVWPVSHIHDTTTLYAQILRSILCGVEIPHGRDGFYLASSGCVAWDDIYSAFAGVLYKRGVIDDAVVEMADGEALGRMGAGLDLRNGGVAVQLGGSCHFAAVNGSRIGWRPEYPPEHILEAADQEVDLILGTLDG
ncbi:uncharacterized protein DSM5745_10676 [Aspergillus mulundensis]|uniref:NAD-dependent epimerase/dehydratase domain-containing protein n=1 Tax=Aspergillus mulundensis TaxID=1810919 RepID=A0A3D8QHK3_9EURO|nr:Uncharacterized protein DSM5745_10676 [Aspergillus mulundensis]RDW61178.1 Uncharacterized protein DSM5745_10676 [Aspergillus mulundensis]